MAVFEIFLDYSGHKNVAFHVVVFAEVEARKGDAFAYLDWPLGLAW